MQSGHARAPGGREMKWQLLLHAPLVSPRPSVSAVPSSQGLMCAMCSKCVIGQRGAHRGRCTPPPVLAHRRHVLPVGPDAPGLSSLHARLTMLGVALGAPVAGGAGETLTREWEVLSQPEGPQPTAHTRPAGRRPRVRGLPPDGTAAGGCRATRSAGRAGERPAT